MDRARTWIALISALALGASLVGCDPKLGAEDTSDNGGDGSDVPVQVSPEALVVGNIVSLHAQILGAALGVSAEYDSASAGSPVPRTFFGSACLTMGTADPLVPVHTLRLDGCSDSNGTTYRGGGEIWPLEGVDGFYFLPYVDAADLIMASNTENDDFNHTYYSGTLEFAFDRDNGGTVIGVQVSKFLRHSVRNEIVTFSYDSVSYSGGVGSHAAWPANGSVVRVGWDSVGIFDVEFTGAATCTYRILGQDYQCDLDSGTVTAIVNL